MTSSIYMDKSHPPNDDELVADLGRSGRIWEDIKQTLAANYPPLTEEWTYSGAKHGWSLRLKQKKRAIVYLIPGRKCFTTTFVLGDKAIAAARDQQDLPQELEEILKSAPKFPEGRAVRLEIKTKKDAVLLPTISAIKMGK